jgi:hypothetical protein
VPVGAGIIACVTPVRRDPKLPTARVRSEDIPADDGNARRVYFVYCEACSGLKGRDTDDEYAATAQAVAHNLEHHHGATMDDERFGPGRML